VKEWLKRTRMKLAQIDNLHGWPEYPLERLYYIPPHRSRESLDRHTGRKVRRARFMNGYEPTGGVFRGAHRNYAKLRGGWKRSVAAEI
jgi:hypothetical protein